MQITQEWLTSRGFVAEKILGYVLHLSDGPGDTELDILVGNFPFNGPCVTVYIGGFGVGTNAATQQDIDDLIRLLRGAIIDHPDEAWIDCDEEAE